MKIIAEISGNHGGLLDNALRLIDAAAKAGADAVKFQCFQPYRLASRRRNNPEVIRLAGGVPLIELYSRTHTPKSWFPAMVARATGNRIGWFSSVFDPVDVAYLETLQCPRYKISAFEMLDWDIIKAVRETGKPVIMSVRPTGNVTVLLATDYAGGMVPVGLSAHGMITPNTKMPMVEYHLKLPGVETPDSAFSLTPDQLGVMVKTIKGGMA